jgi:DNA-binding LacI/PurR family transcriptional regulator
MTRFCIEKGAKRLVFAAGPPVDICLRRQEGFMETASGREVKIIDTGFCIQDGINIAEEILAWNPDAVVCSNDEVAIGVLEGFKAKGVKVPERMLLTGADNIRMSEFCSVPLTTFDQMAYECGRKCVESVKDFLLKKKPMQSVVIPPEVMRRRTA